MNSKRGIIAGLLGVLLFTASGCSDKNNIPSGILSQEKMEGVLWDMIQADQYSTLYLAKDSVRTNTKMETLRLYEEIFRLHQVSREEFRKSYQYYLDHPALSQVLFDSLTAKGVRLRTESYSRPAPFRPIPQVPAPSQVSPAHGPAAAHGSAPSTPLPSKPAPLKQAPGHVPAFPFRPSGAQVRDSATKSILHPAKKEPTRRPV
jgi:hypothetical protein